MMIYIITGIQAPSNVVIKVPTLFLKRPISLATSIAHNLHSCSLIIIFNISVLPLLEIGHRYCLSLPRSAILSTCVFLFFRTRSVALGRVPLRRKELNDL